MVQDFVQGPLCLEKAPKRPFGQLEPILQFIVRFLTSNFQGLKGTFRLLSRDPSF